MVNGRLAQNHVEEDFKHDSETLNNKLLTEENNVKENQPTSEFVMSTNVLVKLMPIILWGFYLKITYSLSDE